VRVRTVVFLSALTTAATASDPDGAEKLYRAGREAVARGDWTTACQKFRASYALAESDSTSIYITDCDARDGNVADAAASLRDIIERLGRADPRDPLIPEATKRLAVVLRRVPRLIVRLAAGAPAGTTVTRDGVELRPGALGEALPVNIGEHTVVTTAPGRKPTLHKVLVAEGKTETIEVDVGETSDAPPAAVRTPATSSTVGGRGAPGRAGDTNTLAYVLGGVGLVGVGVAVFTGASLSSKKSAMDAAHCDATTKVCSGAGMNDGASAADATKAASSGRSLEPFFYGGLAVGVLGLAAGGYLLATSKSDTSTAVRVAPNRVSVEGAF